MRKKNVLATMMQSFAMMAIITVLVGTGRIQPCHSAPETASSAACTTVFLRGVGAQPDPDYAGTIPLQTFMIYQLMFAIITPALITGAFAERMKFSAMSVFMMLWSLLVYAPMAHMVWGKGGFLNAALGGRFPDSGFCRRHGGARHVGSFGAGVRAVSREAASDIRNSRCLRIAWC